MKKLIILPLLTVMLLGGAFPAPAHAQTLPSDLKPTFISPTPGLYVNGWPAFTVTYPKEWVEEARTLGPVAVFQAGVTRPNSYPSPLLTIDVFPAALPLEDWAKGYMPFWLQIATDIKVLSDKPSQSKDGTPAREVQLEWVLKNGPKRNVLQFMTKKDSAWVSVILSADEGKLDEDVKKIARSLTFQPDREEPVKVPPDVRAFLDMCCVDLMGHDVAAIMEHYSDRFHHSGGGKAVIEQFLRNDPLSPIHKDIISEEAIVTVFEPRGDKAYVDGFFLEKVKGGANTVKMPMNAQQIINEHGEWKWFGNRK